jgi:hypothetical protein
MEKQKNGIEKRKQELMEEERRNQELVRDNKRVKMSS